MDDQSNIYCKDLSLGFELDNAVYYHLRNTYTGDLKKNSISLINSIDLRVVNILRPLGISVHLAEAFYVPPKTITQIHVDASEFSNKVKINWTYGKGLMKWYVVKSPESYKVYVNPLNRYSLHFNHAECMEVFRHL